MKKFPSNFYHQHSPQAIHERLNQNRKPSYLKDFVYGAIDGTVTTFAVVSGVVGAELSTTTILILGFANLLADGFSMASGNYLSTKTEIQEQSLIEDFEYNQIKTDPAGEKEEVRQILESKGFRGDMLEEATRLFIQDRKRWVDLMMKEEYGFSTITVSPLRSATITFVSFICFGFIPLAPYVLSLPSTFLGACIMTGAAFFLLGSLKSLWTTETALIAGLKTLAVGSIASSLAYAVGVLLRNIQ